jgi:release factor glutamine methyltransferase
MATPVPSASVLLAELLREATRAFGAAEIEQPRAEARWLLGRVLGLSASDVLLREGETVTADQAERARAAIRRRAAHEPFAYIVGDRDFYGRSFLVDRRVLVPRPETETLVDEALAVLTTQARHPRAKGRRPLVVDVGTGSGAIACTLALESPTSTVIACDISAGALAVAAQNRARLGLDGRLHLVRGSLLDWLTVPADLVTANLPYIPSARVSTLMSEVADWEPHLALDGGPDGLDLIRRLISDAGRVVRPGGTILLELDPEQAVETCSLLPGARGRIVKDLAGLDRVVRLDLPA